MSYRSTFKHNGIVKALGAVAALVVSQQALAGGFAIKEQSTTYLGSAYSGTASTSYDASSNWYNPAGLTELKHSEVVASGIWINGNVKLSNASATIFGFPVAGTNQTKPFASGFIPALHASWHVNNCWTFGFSVLSQFGLKTNYDADSVSHLIATESKITAIDFTPGVAYKINNKFSIGAGFDALRVISKLNADTLFFVPGYLNNTGTGWGYGFHAGVLFKPCETTKMGLTYFSRITPHAHGGVYSLHVPGAGSTFTTSVKLPDRLVYSITHTYNCKWMVMADVEWTHWSVFKQVELDYNNGTSAIENFYYHDAWRVSLGTEYKYNKCWDFRGGIAFEKTPINSTYLSPRLPDSNRYWIAIGTKYHFNKCLSVDAAYAHIFANNATSELNTTFGRTLRGNYKYNANLFGLQLTWTFA